MGLAIWARVTGCRVDTQETEHNMEVVEARLVLQCQCDLDEFLKMVLLLLGSIDNIFIAELLSPTASR